MITIKEVDKELNELRSIDYVKTYEPHKIEKEKNKARKRIKFLKLMRTFLEGEPSSTLLKGQLEKVENTIQIVMTRFSFQQFQNMTLGEIAKKRRNYEKEEDIPKMREHVKVLKYLLKK